MSDGDLGSFLLGSTALGAGPNIVSFVPVIDVNKEEIHVTVKREEINIKITSD